MNTATEISMTKGKPKVKIAIINTRNGPSPLQLNGFRNHISEYNPTKDSFIIGADRGDRSLFSVLRSMDYDMEGYPLNNPIDDIYSEVKMAEPTNISERNQNLVDDSDVVIAIPQYMNEFEDSPLWKTVRLAQRDKKKLIIISPAGWIHDIKG